MGYLLKSVLLHLAVAAGTGAADAVVDFDVVVFGSTPAGIAAATAAGQLGCTVALYEPLPMIGGMVSLRMYLNSLLPVHSRSQWHAIASTLSVQPED
jgi:heterodisulfide reductase subunit A-like polyferredoxin